MSLLRYTGHPFIDVGVATITAFYKKNLPEEVENIEEFEKYVLDKYINQAMSNYLGTVVFANVGYANPGSNGNPKYDTDRREKLATLLKLYKPGASILPAVKAKLVSPPMAGDVCIFSGDPAIARISHNYTHDDERRFDCIPTTGSSLATDFWLVHPCLAGNAAWRTQFGGKDADCS